MARIAAELLDKLVDRLRLALDDLQEVRSVEDQQPGDPVECIRIACGAVDRLEVVGLEVEPREARVSQ